MLRQYHPLALRWFLVSTQYRQPINYTQRALAEVGGWVGAAGRGGGCGWVSGRAAASTPHAPHPAQGNAPKHPPATHTHTHTHSLTPPTCLHPQASDRVYYLYQALADTEEALASTPEGQAALAASADAGGDALPSPGAEVLEEVRGGRGWAGCVVKGQVGERVW